MHVLCTVIKNNHSRYAYVYLYKGVIFRQEQIFKTINIYGSKIEIRVTDNIALIAIDDADDCIITTDLINCHDHQTALSWAKQMCQTATSTGLKINSQIY